MDKIRCVAVDDEPLALKSISSYIQRTPGLILEGSFLNPVEAFDFIMNTEPDVVFMDIQMPDLTGIQLSRLLKGKSRIVFTTAYADYALEGIKVHAVDYLLKPFGYEEFLNAVSVVRNLVNLERKDQLAQPTDDLFFIRVDGRLRPVNLTAVRAIEGSGDYVTWIFESGEKLLVNGSLKDLESRLPSGLFLRIHRSVLLNTTKITAIDRSRVFTGKQYYTVGDSYRQTFEEFLNKRML